MSIAVIGWGSLIWCPGILRIRSRWYKNGPKLPIEFSRVSRDGRLTLAITPDADSVQCLWALSGFDTASEAAENLREREGTLSKYIGTLSVGELSYRDNTSEAIGVWLREQNLKAAVWTALPPKAPDGSNTIMDAERAVEYIGGLANDRRQRAEQYVRNTPEQIETVIRKRLREVFTWQNNLLSVTLFEEVH